MKNSPYFDMRDGIINLTGIRTITRSESSQWSTKGPYSITINYKGIASVSYYYKDQVLYDIVYNELKKRLLGL